MSNRGLSLPTISIRLAETDADFQAARALSYDWAKTHREEFPEYRSLIDRFFDPEEYRETVENLHVIHARPRGAVLLAEIDGEPAGCVMYQPLEPAVAEIKRLYVKPIGRGHGLGKALLKAMIKQMRADGYRSARFNSAKFLDHARTLYKSVGFKEIPNPENLPGYLSDVAYFMERRL